MFNFHDAPLYLLISIFLLAATVIGVFGVKMTHVARRLAADTGMGEALMGAVFIGASTSLSGIVASATAASAGHAEFAVSNALGGIAAQTFFLAVADMFYRKANLEHAAASAENLMMSAFLITLLSIHLIAFAVPNISLFSVHPASYLLIISYFFGVRLLTKTHKMPMWLPRRTRETRIEKENVHHYKHSTTKKLWVDFIIYSVVVGTAGFVLSLVGIEIVSITKMSEGLVGGVFTAVSTSLPELVIAITAVRLKSLTLAVGDIIGGNAFDTLFIAVSDFAYREGPIYASISMVEQFWLAVTILMTGIILMGLLHRQRHGIANIGWESFLVFLIYISSLGYLAV
jgi:cation:H+ antiporter